MQNYKHEFDQHATNYKRNLNHLFRRIVDSNDEYFIQLKIVELRKLINELKLRQEDLAIADIGCGIGDFEKYLRSDFKCLVPVDISFEMLRVAQHTNPLQNSRYVCADAKTLALPENSVDLVLTSCLFHHLPKDDVFPTIAEISRVCRPGGYLICFEHNPINPITQFVIKTTPIDKNAHLLSRKFMDSAFRRTGLVAKFSRFILYGPKKIDRALQQIAGNLLYSLPFGGQYYLVFQKPLV